VNLIPFPSQEDRVPACRKAPCDQLPDPKLNTGHGFRPRPPPGSYCTANKGLLMVFDDPITNDNFADQIGIDWMPAINPKWANISVFPNEPKMLDQVLRSADGPEWAKAHDYSIRQLEKMGVWEIVDLPEGEKAIPHSEIFQDKCGPDGEIEVRRVRIVTGGHKQIKGIDYGETFSATAKMPLVQVVLANAAIQDWEIHHVNIKSAYLNVNMDHIVYMKPPQGILKKGQEGKVSKLLKVIYGAKQSGRLWHKLLSKIMDELRFSRSKIDHLVFFKFVREVKMIIMVTTDDMALTSK
jgi:hypothetical protein